MGNPREGDDFDVGAGSFDTRPTFFKDGKRPTYPLLNPYNRRAGVGFGMADYLDNEKPDSIVEVPTGQIVKTLAKHEPVPVFDLQRPSISSTPTRSPELDLSEAITQEIPSSPTPLPVRQITPARPGEIRASALPSPDRPDPRLLDRRRSPLRLRPAS